MVQERSVRVERRLAAILAADVAGYSRLMHHDEEATHAKLTTLLADGVTPAISEHGGRNGILSLRWGRIHFMESRYTLLTSDRPLDMPYGLQSQDSYIVLPIGPRTIFTATRDPVSLNTFSGKDQTNIVRLINDRVIAQARQYVWAMDDQARQFVQKHINTLPDRQLISDRPKARGEPTIR
jgi:class 3 adenylate cyclase